MMNKHIFCFSILCCFLFVSCADEQNDAQDQDNKIQLTNRWELTSAQRSGKKTETLRDAYFDLKEDGTAIVNLDGRPQDARWETTANLLTLSDTQSDYLAADYEISNLQDSTVTLSVTWRDMPFVMDFKIAKEEEEEVQ